MDQSEVVGKLIKEGDLESIESYKAKSIEPIAALT